MARPVIGITCDVEVRDGRPRVQAARAYAERTAASGAIPVLLAPFAWGDDAIDEVLARVEGLVLTGGDDPATEAFGVPTHPLATRVHPDRQAFETGLLRLAGERRPELPVLGVCLGMQMMGLVAGGRLAQHMPESHPRTHREHWDADHAVEPEAGGPLARATVHSRHRQCLEDAGSLRVAARAGDGVIEGVHDPGRRFYLGVQWHPERTADERAGQSLFDALVRAAR